MCAAAVDVDLFLLLTFEAVEREGKWEKTTSLLGNARQVIDRCRGY